MSTKSSYDADTCSCPDCTPTPGTCSHHHAEIVSPKECCELLLAKVSFDLPVPTVMQCTACLRLWEWCGTIDGKGVIILVTSDLTDPDDLPDC